MVICKINREHSSILFRVRYLGILDVLGTFDLFRGSISTENNELKNAVIDCRIEVNSLHTGNSKRDEELLSARYFNALEFPEIIFKSLSCTAIGNNYHKHHIKGELTMKNKKQEIELQAEYLGRPEDMDGNQFLAFYIYGKLDRTAFDMESAPQNKIGYSIVDNIVSYEANILTEYKY